MDPARRTKSTKMRLICSMTRDHAPKTKYLFQGIFKPNFIDTVYVMQLYYISIPAGKKNEQH